MLWQVSTIHGRAESGRGRPPRVDLINASGSAVEAYLKSPTLHEAKSPYSLEREWIASRLARDLGLPCAQVVAIQVTPQFEQMATAVFGRNTEKTTNGETLAERLSQGPRLLIGSVSLGTGWSEWSQALPVSKAQLEMATKIYFFDTLIQNWDRVMPNPNLLMKNDQYGMIDHEESFVQAAGTDAERDITLRPWLEGGIVNDVGYDLEHPLWRGIKRHQSASFAAAVQQWKSLPEATIRGYADHAVFDHWSRHVANKITDYLLDAIEQVDEVYMQVEANRCN